MKTLAKEVENLLFELSVKHFTLLKLMINYGLCTMEDYEQEKEKLTNDLKEVIRNNGN